MIVADKSNFCSDGFGSLRAIPKKDGEKTERYWNGYKLSGYAENCNPELCTNSSNGSGNLRRLVAT